jgi:hypothetical protein
MEPDYSVESLAAVDHYLAQLHASRPEQIADIASQVGCYFGEVLRRAFGAEWKGSPAEDPRAWTLSFAAAPLSISPVGMAAEAIYHDEVGEYDGSLHAPPLLLDALEQALSSMADVPEDYYYSLTGRLETIQHVLDVLVQASRAPSTPR